MEVQAGEKDSTGESPLALPAVTTTATATEPKEPAKSAEAAERDDTRICWLTPDQVCFKTGPLGQLKPQTSHPGLSGLIHGTAFVVRTFPASHPNEYLSVRGWNDQGDEVELGVIRDLAQWPKDQQIAIERTLRKRYLLRKIHRVYKVDLRHGFLECHVETEAGQQMILLRWSASQAIDYGEDGKLLIDTEENRYLVPSVSQLPEADRERFEQYIYW
jgi:hypothetical protein